MTEHGTFVAIPPQVHGAALTVRPIRAFRTEPGAHPLPAAEGLVPHRQFLAHPGLGPSPAVGNHAPGRTQVGNVMANVEQSKMTERFAARDDHGESARVHSSANNRENRSASSTGRSSTAVSAMQSLPHRGTTHNPVNTTTGYHPG